jgi:hypothetical protein
MPFGKVYDDVDPVPATLVGAWLGAATGGDVELTIAGNQASLKFLTDFDYSDGSTDEPLDVKGAIPFRIALSTTGDADRADLVRTANSESDCFVIEFYDFMAKGSSALKGTIQGYFPSATDDTKFTIWWSQAENYAYGIPPKGDYEIK